MLGPVTRLKPGSWVASAAKPTKGAIKAATIFTWMETYVPIAAKDGTRQPFRHNDAQLWLAQIIAEDMDAGRPVWLVIVKGRQMGISFYVELFLLACCVLSAGDNVEFRSALVAHDDAAASRVFSYFRSAAESLPEGFDRAALPIESWNLAQVKWEAGAEHRIYSIKTGGGLGLGGRLNAIHYTEAGNYADKGLDAQAAYEAVQGCVYRPDSIVIMESTANGHDPFFWRIVEAARKGENDFRLVFLPWFLESTYTLDWQTFRRSQIAARRPDPGYEFVPNEEELTLRASLAYPVDDSQRDFRWQHSPTDGQFTWRRSVCRNDYSGSNERMRRFYPSTIEEAFATTEATFFTVDEMTRFGAMVREHISRGNALLGENGAAEWRPDPVGFTRVWEPPLPGERYLVAGDVAEGRGKDFSAAYVLHVESYRVVAALHSQAPWEITAASLLGLAVYYNQAVLAVDNKPQSIVDWLARENYHRLYYHRNDTTWRPGSPSSPGFSITNNSRPLILDALARAVRELKLSCPDPGFVQEMATFVWVERNGRYEATWNSNDDRVLAMAIGCFLCQSHTYRGASWAQEAAGVTDPAERMLHELRRFARACGYAGDREVPSL